METASIISELEATIANGTDEQKSATLSRITDLFLADATRFTDAQIAIFDDVIVRLATAMETAVRRELSLRLATAPAHPPATMQHLASDDDLEVAAPVLTLCTTLKTSFLETVARTKSNAHRLAIAKRPVIEVDVTTALIEAGDIIVAREIASNQGAKFSPTGFEQLTEKAKGDDTLSESIGLRTDIPAYLFRIVLNNAAAHVREKLMAEAPVREHARLKTAVRNLAKTVVAETQEIVRDYSRIAEEIRVLHHAGKLDRAALEAYAKAGKFEETVCCLAVLCNLSLSMTEKLMLGERVDPILILAKGANLDWSAVSHVLKVRPQNNGLTKTSLVQARDNFDRVQPNMAEKVLSFWRTKEPGPSLP